MRKKNYYNYPKIVNMNVQWTLIPNVKAKIYPRRVDMPLKSIIIKIKRYVSSEYGLVSLFNGIPTFVGYLMPKLFSLKNSSGAI